MLRMNRLTMTLTTFIALTACQQPPAELSQADKDGVKAMIEKYRQAAIAGDWTTWGSTLANDVVVSPANIAPVIGRDAAVVWVKSIPKSSSLTVNVDEVSGRGDVAYARGTYVTNMVLPDGSPLTDHGSFLEVHRRQADGTWPYTHIMFHSTDPLPAAPAPSATMPAKKS